MQWTELIAQVPGVASELGGFLPDDTMDAVFTVAPDRASFFAAVEVAGKASTQSLVLFFGADGLLSDFAAVKVTETHLAQGIDGEGAEAVLLIDHFTPKPALTVLICK